MDLRRSVTRHRRGTVFLTHAMIPHEPYILDSSCRAVASAAVSAQSPVGLWRSGLEQVGCSSSLLQAFFTELQENGMFDEAKIVLISDHGFRISEGVVPIDEFSRQDLVWHFGALAAIKEHSVPRTTPGGARDEVVSVREVVAGALLSGRKIESSDRERLRVYLYPGDKPLVIKDRTPRVREIPDLAFWKSLGK